MAIAHDKRIDEPAGVQGSIGAADATPFLVWAYGVNSSAAGAASLGDGHSVEFDLRIRVHASDGAGNITGVANLHRRAIFKVPSGTTATLVGSVQSIAADDIDPALTGIRVYFDNTATGIQLWAVGVAATLTYWYVFAKAYIAIGAA